MPTMTNNSKQRTFSLSVTTISRRNVPMREQSRRSLFFIRRPTRSLACQSVTRGISKVAQFLLPQLRLRSLIYLKDAARPKAKRKQKPARRRLASYRSARIEFQSIFPLFFLFLFGEYGCGLFSAAERTQVCSSQLRSSHRCNYQMSREWRRPY